MKKLSKITAILMALVMMMQCSFSAYASSKTGSLFTTSTYTHQSKFDGFSIEQGIDVSYHNGTIDWSKIKKAGVDFAILRVGYRGYAPIGKVLPDNNFKTYIKDAYAQGIKLGIYFYSQALTTEEAVAEAEFSISKLTEAVADIPDFKLELPIFYDYEFADKDGRLDLAWANKTLNKTKMTNNALAFCNTVRNAGYDAMVYANKSFLNTQLNKTTIANAGYGVWLAHYTTNTDYTGDFKIWQYSSSGKVNGTTGNGGKVDCNFMYIDNSKVRIDPIEGQGYTGAEIKPEPVVTYEDKLLVKDTDYTLEYYNNINIGTGNVTVVFKGEYESVPMKSATFKIVAPAVKNVRLDQRDIYSLDVSWDAVNGATGYKVEVKRSEGWVDAGKTKKTSITVKSLAAASNYYIRVRAYNTILKEDYDGIYSEEFLSATKPDKITYITTNDRTTTSVNLYWTKQSNASYYNIYMYNPDTKKYEICRVIKGGKNNTANITGLKANQSYKFKLQAVKDAKEGLTFKGEKSAAYTAYTKPSTPKVKSITSPSKKTVKVKWSKVSGVYAYQVKFGKNKNFSETGTKTYTGASNVSKVFKNLKSNKTYYFKIRSYKKVNGGRIYSPWSKVYKVKVK